MESGKVKDSAKGKTDGRGTIAFGSKDEKQDNVRTKTKISSSEESAPESFESKFLIGAQRLIFRNEYDILANCLPHNKPVERVLV